MNPGLDVPELKRALSGDAKQIRAAFPTLVVLSIPRLERFLAPRLVSRSELRVLLPEIFLQLYRELPNLPRETRLSTWVFAGAFRRMSQSKRIALPSDGGNGNISSGCEVPETLPSDRKLTLLEAETTLPDPLRHSYWLCDVEGFTDREAAYILGMTAETARRQRHLARRWLAARMGTGMGLEASREVAWTA